MFVVWSFLAEYAPVMEQCLASIASGNKKQLPAATEARDVVVGSERALYVETLLFPHRCVTIIGIDREI